MVNTELFQTSKGALPPAADALNNELAPAYAMSPRHQLAQLAATGCLSNTFYASAQTQLDAVLELAQKVEPAFVAKAAIHARQAGHMKDMPALLAATLAVRDVALLARVFARVIDNGGMLRNFVQILRSGVVGRKSLGTRPKKLVQQWLLAASEKQLLNASIGNAPSLADVVKMVHPKPAEAWRAAWFAWLIGKAYDESALPPLTRAYERYKCGHARGGANLPDVPFQMLTSLQLSTAGWTRVALAGSWQMVRQNLNTFARHDVFKMRSVAKRVAAKLRDPQAMAAARVMPYQLMATYNATDPALPAEVRDALQDALEIALSHVPAFEGHVVVCPDASSSMSAPVTGQRGSATTKMRCSAVAAMLSAAILHKNRFTRVLPFGTEVLPVSLNPRDSVLTNAKVLAALQGGGTNCSAPLALLNIEDATVDLVIIVSDNESWMDPKQGRGTRTMLEWEALRVRNPHARLVCIDLQPYGTTQAVERADILNVGGFSDAVFDTIARFVAGTIAADHWVGEIEKVSLEVQ